MPTFKLVISYDGTDYYGWQEQPLLPTIEGLFKQRLKKLFKTPVFFTGASRTDVGVHALGQVARCSVDFSLSENELKAALNNVLPSDIHVRSVTEVPDTFHPRRNVQEKTYIYHFFTEVPSPFMTRFGVHVKTIDIERFTQALRLFQGTHDFQSFCTGDQGRTTVRTIIAIDVNMSETTGMYRVTIKGPSFLRHMIRRILGACFDVARDQGKPLTLLTDALTEKNPRQHFTVAPPHGLLLQSITYNHDS